MPHLLSLGVEGKQRKKFNIDGVTLIRHNLYGIQIQCWECEEVHKSPSALQNHLNDKHGGSVCPGKRCGGFIPLSNTQLELSAHIESHHFWTSCPLGHVVHLREYGRHLLKDCTPPEDRSVCILSRDSIAFPSDDVPLKKVPQGGAYFLDGELCTVDGIDYCIRQTDFAIIVDCPVCKKGIGLCLLGSHLSEDHSLSDKVPCLSPGCSSKELFPSRLRKHILEKHSSLRCQDCGLPLTILEVRHHLRHSCPSRNLDSGPSRPRLYPTLPCPFCRSEVLHLNRHIQEKHPPMTTCVVCSQNVRKANIADHMRKEHLGGQKDLYLKKCYICNEDVLKLDNHMEAMHGQKKSELIDLTDGDI